MLEIENVTVTFPDGRDRVVALDDVSLEINCLLYTSPSPRD